MTSLPSTFPITVHQAHVLSGMSVTKTLLGPTKWKGFTPQDLRRSFGQAHYERDKDVFGTAALMRHSVKMSEEEYLQTDKDLRRRLMKGTGKGTVPRETKSIRTRKP